VSEVLDLSKFKPVGWYVSGEVKIPEDGDVSVTGIGGLFEEGK
jgi:hypothetical protein